MDLRESIRGGAGKSGRLRRGAAALRAGSCSSELCLAGSVGERNVRRTEVERPRSTSGVLKPQQAKPSSQSGRRVGRRTFEDGRVGTLRKCRTGALRGVTGNQQ